MASGTAHQYRSASPLRERQMPGLVYVAVTMLVWAPVVFVIVRWLYP